MQLLYTHNMTYDEILKKEGSFRKAAKFCGITKTKFTVLWKREQGLCERRTSCKNLPMPGKTLCSACAEYLIRTTDKALKKKSSKVYRDNNLEKLRAYNRTYVKNNLDRYKVYNKKYRSSTKGKASGAAKTAKRRAAKRGATPPWVSKEDLKAIYKNCPKGHHVDHIIPLQHADVCGLHVPWNLQYLTAFENDSKGNQWDGTYDNQSWKMVICHQYRKRLETQAEDKVLGFSFDLKVSDFSFQAEPMSNELSSFIARYEWLGNVGWSVKWAFTARHEGKLAGVVLIANPTKPSNFVNNQREALIQRGAAASWAPKNLNSKLLMFACRWMVQNTDRRIFVAYSDPEAGEIGTIYQACNFRYLGATFGRSESYVLESGKKVSGRYFTRTSSMKKWAKQLGITWDKTWNKASGYQDIQNIPVDIRELLNQHATEQRKKCKKVQTPFKGKYMLVLGSDKREQKLLDKEFENYKSLSYPKRTLQS